jgi:excinuclease ABC subunit A
MSLNTIKIINASVNNLKNISLSIPLKNYVAFIGRSGSGKTTLAVNVILAGYVNGYSCVSVPVKPVLFKQRISGYSQKISLLKYLQEKETSKGKGILLTDYLGSIGETHRFSAFDLTVIAQKLGVESLRMDKLVSEMSLSEYNKCRFIKILINSDAELFIVDEIGAGLSFAEAHGVASVIRYIVSMGLSVITIDHSLPIIGASDYIVELGPLAGDAGGEIVFSGITSKFKKTEKWKTMIQMCGKKMSLKQGSRKLLRMTNINFHSFVRLNVSIPLDGIVVICGGIGSGKTSLLDIIFRAYDKSANAWKNRNGIDGETSGKNYIRRPYIIDQTPIGNNPASTPATYIGIMDSLRNIYFTSEDNKSLKYRISDFSYNTTGKCPECGGMGYQETEVNEEFIYIPCAECGGSRYAKKINNVKENGFSIGHLLQLTCRKIYELYLADNSKKSVTEKIGFINEVGLSYLNLGQPSSALSGGESQRIKITKELSKKLGDRCLFILDAPSKGLHIGDMANIVMVLKKLVAKNNSIILAENHPIFVSNSDWIIYLDAGKIMYEGIPNLLPQKYREELGIEGTYYND